MGTRGWTRAASTAVAVAVLLAGCSSGGADDDAVALDRVEDDGEDRGGDLDAVAVAEEWVANYEGAEDDDGSELELVGAREAVGVTHVRFRQVVDDVPVRAAQLVVHVDDEGEVVGASDSLTEARPDPGVEQELEEDEAVDIAGRAVPGGGADAAGADIVWLPDGEGLRLGWSVRLSAPAASYSVWVDAVTGDVADARETTLHAQVDGDCDDLDPDDGPVACLFVPDPATASGEFPSPDEADDFRVPVELQGLDDPSSGELVGEFVTVVSEITEPDGVWDQGSGEPGFEDAMAYFWIDAAQRQVQALGFDDIRNESIQVVARDENVVDNARFDASIQAIFLGVRGDGVHDAAEDAQVILHEYGHAILDAQVPAMIFNDGGIAYHDGFADTFAALMTVGVSEDPGCIAPWFFGDLTGTGCARRADGEKVFPDDLVNEPHADGEIWSGAVLGILDELLAAEGLSLGDCVGTDACDPVRDRVLALALETNEFLTGSESFSELGEAMALANRSAFGGEDQDVVEDQLSARGLLGGGPVVVGPDGQPSGDAPAVEVAVDLSHSFRGDLRIDVIVVDGAGDLLCQVRLLDPASGDDADNVTGGADLSSSECADFAPPAPEQRWALVVEDTAAQDTGQINSFAVVADGVPFLATGVPAPIPDDDPSGVAVVVDATGQDVPQEGTAEPGETVVGAPFASIEIIHSFVGDLQVRVGVVDLQSVEVLCSIPVLEPDPQDGADEIGGDVDLSSCAAAAVPGAAWFVEVVDTVARDTGTIERFEVFAGDGALVGAGEVPVAIPDADPNGAASLVPI